MINLFLNVRSGWEENLINPDCLNPKKDRLKGMQPKWPGRTQVHRNSCSFMSQWGKHPCSCPKTILQDSGLTFYANGREWDRGLGLVNPAADKLVKDYLCLVTGEQLQVRETSKQATPFFVNKLRWSAEHFQRPLGKAKTNIIFWAFYCGSWPRIFQGEILQWWPAQ